MKKRIKKKIKKLKKSINKINKVRVQKGRKAMLQETWATVTYGLYDNRKIRRLKKFPPALVENRMLFETNDDFTDNYRFETIPAPCPVEEDEDMLYPLCTEYEQLLSGTIGERS